MLRSIWISLLGLFQGWTVPDLESDLGHEIDPNG